MFKYRSSQQGMGLIIVMIMSIVIMGVFMAMIALVRNKMDTIQIYRVRDNQARIADYYMRMVRSYAVWEYSRLAVANTTMRQACYGAAPSDWNTFPANSAWQPFAVFNQDAATNPALIAAAGLEIDGNLDPLAGTGNATAMWKIFPEYRTVNDARRCMRRLRVQYVGPAVGSLTFKDYSVETPGRLVISVGEAMDFGSVTPFVWSQFVSCPADYELVGTHIVFKGTKTESNEWSYKVTGTDTGYCGVFGNPPNWEPFTGIHPSSVLPSGWGGTQPTFPAISDMPPTCFATCRYRF